MSIVVKEGMQLFCPGHMAGETCGAWLATARVDVEGNVTVIDDAAFFFVDGIWGEDDMGMFCPYCGQSVDRHFINRENWRERDDATDNQNTVSV